MFEGSSDGGRVDLLTYAIVEERTRMRVHVLIAREVEVLGGRSFWNLHVTYQLKSHR